MKRRLRSGYTTGACAAAAAKAATVLLFHGHTPTEVHIPFPDGSRVSFPVQSCTRKGNSARCSVVKDAGDDPDVTNGAEIVAVVSRRPNQPGAGVERIAIIGGRGVGLVTKPGLAVAVGQPAINPVPLAMIRQAVGEGADGVKPVPGETIEVCIEVPAGELLATKTLNRRLGIIGGISILGTTGIVQPISAAAWTATIAAAMDVAAAVGIEEIVLSTGRTSERSVETLLQVPEEALIMMGDYLDFALREAGARRFRAIHMAAMWAKLIKGAMGIGQTHVRHGMLSVPDICTFLTGHGIAPSLIGALQRAHTARDMLEMLRERGDQDVISLICSLAKAHYEQLSGLPVSIYLVHASGKILQQVPA